MKCTLCFGLGEIPKNHGYDCDIITCTWCKGTGIEPKLIIDHEIITNSKEVLNVWKKETKKKRKL